MKTAEDRSSDGSSVILVCPRCGSNLVYPLEQYHVSRRKWCVLLTCPECFSWRIKYLSNREMILINCDAEQSAAQIARALAAAERDNMREECERFIAALAAGNIQPIDF